MVQNYNSLMSKYQAEVQADAARYTRAKPILDDLKAYHRAGLLTYQQFHTLRGQALSGDRDGAIRGMNKLLKLGEGNYAKHATDKVR